MGTDGVAPLDDAGDGGQERVPSGRMTMHRAEVVETNKIQTKCIEPNYQNSNKMYCTKTT
jgi:hypothetical protein